MTKYYFILFFFLRIIDVSAQSNTFPLNGNVGVGTSNPLFGKLQINAPDKDVSSALVIRQDNNPNYGYDFGLDQQFNGHGYFFAVLNNVRTALMTFDRNSNNVLLNGGKIGIGSTNPSELLTIGSEESGVTDRKALRFGTGGMSQPAGLNISSNGDKIVLFDNISNQYDARIGVGSQGNLWMKSIGNNMSNSFEWYSGNDISSAKMTLSGTGNLSLGTLDAKGYKLAVAGSMIAELVKVKLQSAWPDYVFTKGYRLPSLLETEKQIKETGHLPGIPSATEVKANGIDLGEMNAKLLEKIEELTLYLIDIKKQEDARDKNHNKEIDALSAKIESLEKIIKRLK